MRDSRERVCRTCFGVLLVVGVGFLFLGLIVVPLRPDFQLEVVLSPDELVDPHRRAEMLALLRRAAGNQWLFWTASGVVVIVTSGIGLWAALGLGYDEKGGSYATDEL